MDLIAKALNADVLDLSRGDARWDYKRILKILRLQRKELAALLGTKEDSVRFDKRMSCELHELFGKLATCICLVADFFENEVKTEVWFATDNPLLGNISPRQMIILGRTDKLIKFIVSQREGNMP